MVQLLDTSPRAISEEQQEWLAQQPFWYCNDFPLYMVPPRRRAPRRNIGADWFKRLKDDIGKNGLRSPILLNNSDNTTELNPFTDRVMYSVNAGNHRVMAAEQLGWLTIRALVWGRRPYGVMHYGPMTIFQARRYITDGNLEMAWHGPVLRGAKDAKVEFGG